MKKKYPKVLFIIFCSLLIVTILIWASINFFVIPKIIIPRINEIIEKQNIDSPVKLIIKKITFHPFKGFLLKDVSLTGPITLKTNQIMRARTIDIDLDFLPLFLKRIVINKIKISHVIVDIGRNQSGTWNLQPLFNMSPKEKKDKGPKFIIENIQINKCTLNYSDSYKNNNTLERRIDNVNLHILNTNNRIFRLTLSGRSPKRKKESFNIKLRYDASIKSLKGSANISTIYLDKYWNYYLNELLSPWYLQADNVMLTTNFDWQDKNLAMNGQCVIKDGTLRYGDVGINANSRILLKLKYSEGSIDSGSTSAELFLENAVFTLGNNVIVNNGKGNATISDKKINIKKLSGILKEHPLDLSGEFTYTKPGKLHLIGTLGDLKNDLRLHIMPNEKGILDWEFSFSDSTLLLHADIHNLKELSCILNLHGSLNIHNFSVLPFIDKYSVQGTINISGNIQGELDKFNSLDGNMTVKIQDFSVLNLEKASFEYIISLKNGLLEGNIPKSTYCKGSLHGLFRADIEKVGIEIMLDKFDIADLVENNPRFKGATGSFSGNATLITKWSSLSSFFGGGYFHFDNANLWNSTIFSATKDGIKTVVDKKAKDVKLPEFKKIKGNFDINQELIRFTNTLCELKGMEMHINGTMSFTGKVDFTVGVKILGHGLLRTVRQIVLPLTLAFDAAANSIQVRITGTLPDVHQKTGIQPLGWLTTFFPSGKASANRYSLQKLWGKETHERKTPKQRRQERRERRQR